MQACIKTGLCSLTQALCGRPICKFHGSWSIAHDTVCTHVEHTTSPLDKQKTFAVAWSYKTRAWPVLGTLSHLVSGHSNDLVAPASCDHVGHPAFLSQTRKGPRGRNDICATPTAAFTAPTLPADHRHTGPLCNIVVSDCAGTECVI